MNSELGKLLAVHSTSPAFLQRAAIVAGLSFLFFLTAVIFYLVWQSFLFFLLATGFLIVQIFTMTGWWMQKRNAVNIYANGLVYQKRAIFWTEIEEVQPLEDSSLRIVPKEKEKEILKLPASIQGLNRINAFVSEKLGVPLRS